MARCPGPDAGSMIPPQGRVATVEKEKDLVVVTRQGLFIFMIAWSSNQDFSSAKARAVSNASSIFEGSLPPA